MRTTLDALKKELDANLNTKSADAVSEMIAHTAKVADIVLEMDKITGHYYDCTITLSEAFTTYISLAKQLHAESADSPLGFMQVAYEALLDDAEKLEAFIASLD